MNPKTTVAWLTGSKSVIGGRTALAFLEEGYSVTLVGRRRKPIEASPRQAAGNVLPATAVLRSNVRIKKIDSSGRSLSRFRK